MRVQNIECQLAQGQINRYMNGDALSETALEQLEEHVAECELCAGVLEEKKQALQALINVSTTAPFLESTVEPKPKREAKLRPGFAVIETEDVEPQPAEKSRSATEKSQTPKFLVEAIRNKSRELDQAVRSVSNQAVIEDTREPAAQPKAFVKPLLYSLALGAVLIAMSTIMKDPTRLLGERAKDSLLPAVNQPASTPETTSNPTTLAAGTASATESILSAEEASAIVASSASDALQGATNGASVSVATKETEPPATVAENIPEPTVELTPTTTTAQRPAVKRNAPTRRSQPARRNNTARAPRAAASPARSGGGITIYDSNGNPIR